MYDPEFNMATEKLMNDFCTIMDNIRQKLGETHPITMLCESVGYALELIDQRKNDYDNCFDEEESKKIAAEIRGMITSLWESVKCLEDI